MKVAIPQCDLSRWIAALLDSSALICVYRRPDLLFFPPNAKIKTCDGPPMNADQRR
jgi:hypothetical protein